MLEQANVGVADGSIEIDGHRHLLRVRAQPDDAEVFGLFLRGEFLVPIVMQACAFELNTVGLVVARWGDDALGFFDHGVESK